MSTPVISARGICKRYILGGKQSHDTLRDSLAQLGRATLNLGRKRKKPNAETSEDSILWALKDISFDIEKGHAVGLIGRNGSGKSTMLKILSQITEPTSGEVRIRGRVASLLEVGTGFHPELSGRENIYLNGAILGMTRAEIRRKYDEIVAFAEVERFLDTPVKRYSSGMYVRLAFAVAAHLEPEILVVDEVLAVGDTAFRTKCMGKMSDIAGSGRTVILVSHNLGAVSQLCQSAIWFDGGKLMKVGKPDETIASYISHLKQAAATSTEWERSGTGKVRFTSISVEEDKGGTPIQQMPMGAAMTVVLRGTSTEKLSFGLSMQVAANTGNPVLYACNQDLTFSVKPDKEFLIRVHFPKVDLMPGSYFLNVLAAIHNVEQFDYVKSVCPFEVYQSNDVPMTSQISHHHGLVFAHCEYEQAE